jgi:hypothetical protein
MDQSSEQTRGYVKRLLMSRIRILFTNGFYGLLLMHMEFAIDTRVETACTDGRKIYFGPSFLGNLTDDELDFVMMHEVMHCALQHFSRGKDLDHERFNMYYPASFQQEFKDNVIEYLTRDSAYYNDLRNIYINYDLTAQQFEALNTKYGLDLPTATESGQKSDLWFVNGDVVDHYYYITVDEAGVKTEHEIASPSDAPAGVNVYEVYQSSKWVYSRYSDDTGGRITSVRPQYMPAWKELLTLIPFEDWIFNSSENTYSVNFTRQYILYPQFRVFDESGKMGKDTETKYIELN